MENIFNYTKKDLENYFINLNEKSFKATQVFEWVYRKRVFNTEGFLNMNSKIKKQISEDFTFDFIKVRKVEEDTTVSKFLFELFDGEFIEAVLMRHNYGLSVCVSSQVGCNMGCKFCESGKLKKVRNLEVYEMVEQILLIENHIKEKINSIVIMGIGEPFDNFENVTKFLTICNEPKGLEIGARHMTVSTCGVVPKIIEFSEFPLQVNLAISLHASNNELRNTLMPINKVYDLEKLIGALKMYIERTKRRVTIEYVLLKNINDTSKNAHELSRLLKGINVYVNLIYYNETSAGFKSSEEEVAQKFCEILKLNNIDVTIRKKFGNKITAACGQLRSSEEK